MLTCCGIELYLAKAHACGGINSLKGCKGCPCAPWRLLGLAGNGVPAVPAYTFLVLGDPDLNPVYWSASSSSTAEPVAVLRMLSSTCGAPNSVNAPCQTAPLYLCRIWCRLAWNPMAVEGADRSLYVNVYFDLNLYMPSLGLLGSTTAGCVVCTIASAPENPFFRCMGYGCSRSLAKVKFDVDLVYRTTQCTWRSPRTQTFTTCNPRPSWGWT